MTKTRDNPFQVMHDSSRIYIEYIVILIFVDVHTYGAEIYCDSMNMYLIKYPSKIIAPIYVPIIYEPATKR